MHERTIAVVALATLAGLTALAASRADDAELGSHIESLRLKLEDRTLDLGARERIAMELASVLDRAAQRAASPDERRSYWSRAIEVLDRFRGVNPGHPLRRVFEVQAAVYRWALARTWVLPERADDADDRTKALAIAELKHALDRLLPAVSAYGNANDPQAQNARYRLAQTLADLAVFLGEDAREQRARNEEALAALSKPFDDPILSAYGNLLKAQILTRLARLAEAGEALDAAVAAKSAPPEREILDARVELLIAGRRFQEALEKIDGSKLDPGSKLSRRAKVSLREREQEGLGPRRQVAESRLFADLKALRDSGSPEAGAWLATASRSIPMPDDQQGPDAWDLLSDGALQRGNPDRAGELALKAAELSTRLGDVARAVALQLKAGAAFFQAGRFEEAAQQLSQVARNEQAGEQRPRAAMLSVHARARSLAAKSPGATAASYEAALKYMLDTFPDHPASGEARWLLGRLRLAGGDKEGALRLWKEIPRGSTNWLDAVSETVRLYEEEIETLRINGDLDAIGRRLDEARTYLGERLAQAQGDQESNEIRLLLARIELTTGAGKPSVARDQAELVLRSVASDPQRDLARGLLIVALAQLGRYVEAEQKAMTEAGASPVEPARLLETLRLLDRSATEADTDLRARRMGLLMTILARPLAREAGAMPPSTQAEVRLREIRGDLFSGGGEQARRLVNGWNTSSLASRPQLLRDLGDTFLRLEAYKLAADVQRLRMKQLPAGSLPWLEARYGLALALYRGGQQQDATQLIDATAILHPELGGGELKDRFVRLRQRLGAPGSR